MKNPSLLSRLAPVFLVGGMLSNPVFAQGKMPTLEDPSRGSGKGILTTLQNYSYDIIKLVALAVIASIFIGVCYHAYICYNEIHSGKKTWGQFGLTVAIGALLLVLWICLLTQATGIL